VRTLIHNNNQVIISYQINTIMIKRIIEISLFICSVSLYEIAQNSSVPICNCLYATPILSICFLSPPLVLEIVSSLSSMMQVSNSDMCPDIILHN